MKIIQINTVYKIGSTGKIAYSIQQKSLEDGINNIVAYRYAEKCHLNNTYEISTWLDCHIHNRVARYTHKTGNYSIIRTKKFIKYLDKIKPDIVHLHNIHGSFINLKLFFDYLSKKNIKIIWTLHDCWAFTGNCPYFDLKKCYQWKNGCNNCPLFGHFLGINTSKNNWIRKKYMINSLPNLVIVTPSQWLADMVKQSFLKDWPVKVINNGIDLSVFKPRQSDFREKYLLQNKFLLLGVAFDWGIRKGLDVFAELSKRLDSEKFQIILVGTNDEIDKQLPKNIISIHRTHNQQELAEIYSACDLFVNPTREENYPTVNMESIACGTPVLTFNTGGSHEILTPNTGSIVDCDDIDGMEKEIVRIEKEKPFKKEDCVEHAKSFDMNERFKEYIDLYKRIIKDEA